MTFDAADLTLRRKLCRVARALFERGHNAPADGNLSVKLDNRGYLATPSGVHKGRLQPASIVALDAAGVPTCRGDAPSSELKMHLAIYSCRPDVRAIVHAHSPHAVALTVAGLSLAEPVVPEAVFALGGIPTVPYASPTTCDVAHAVEPFARTHNAFVLERHGTVTLGESIDEAYSRLEVVEHTARITWLAHAAGGARPLPAAERDRLMALAASLRP